MMAGYIATLRVHIEAGQAGGFIGTGLRPGETASGSCGWPSAASTRWSASASDVQLEPIIDSFTDIIWHTLYAPAQTLGVGRNLRVALSVHCVRAMPSVTRKSQGSRAERREQLEETLLAAVEKLLARR